MQSTGSGEEWGAVGIKGEAGRSGLRTGFELAD